MGAHVPRAAKLPCKQIVVGSIPTVSTPNWAARPRGRRRHGMSEIGVQFPGGPLHEGLMVREDSRSAVAQAGWWTARDGPGGPGSTPGESTRIRKVAGYGWPDRGANAAPRKGIRVRIPCLPLLDASMVKWTSYLASNELWRSKRRTNTMALVVKWDIISRFEREVSDSSSDRGAYAV